MKFSLNNFEHEELYEKQTSQVPLPVNRKLIVRNFQKVQLEPIYLVFQNNTSLHVQTSISPANYSCNQATVTAKKLHRVKS